MILTEGATVSDWIGGHLDPKEVEKIEREKARAAEEYEGRHRRRDGE